MIGEDLPAEGQPENGVASKRLRWFELSLVLLIAVGGAFLNSLYILINGRDALQSMHPQNLRWVTGLLRELTVLLLLAYILSRRKMRFRDLGLRWSFRDLGIGLVVAAVSYIAYLVGYPLVFWLHRALFSAAQSGLTMSEVFGHPSIWAIPFSLLNPFFEELVVRAYLMTEIKDLTGSWTLSILLSVVVQSSYHLYYGWVTALALAFQFLVLSIYYARRQRVLPLIVAHGFFDLYGLVRLW